MINNKSRLRKLTASAALFIYHSFVLDKTSGLKRHFNCLQLFMRGMSFKTTKPDSLKFYLQASIDYAGKHNVLSYSLANSYFATGTNFYRFAKYAEALSAFEEYRKVAEKLKETTCCF